MSKKAFNNKVFNNSLFRNVIAILFCILLELLGMWLYIQWTKIGETKIILESSTITDIHRINTYKVADEITIPMNYGGIHNSQTDTICTNIDTARYDIIRTGWTKINPPNSISDTVYTIKPEKNWNNAKRVDNDNYMSIHSISYFSSIPTADRNRELSIDTFFHSGTLIKEITREIIITNGSTDTVIHDYNKNHIDIDMITSIVVTSKAKSHKHYGTRFEYKTSRRFSDYNYKKEIEHHDFYHRPLSFPPKWYRFEDLSRRIICIDLCRYMDSISKLTIDFYGPFKVVSSDISPDSTTMTRLLFYKPYTINMLKKTNGNILVLNGSLPRFFYIEFPYMEHIQEARILVLTTLMISVLLTLILNCFIAVGKIVRQESKMKKIRIDSIPCYGSFSDCSECSMYDTCTYRPMNRTYYRIHRKPHTIHQEET